MPIAMMSLSRTGKTPVGQHKIGLLGLIDDELHQAEIAAVLNGERTDIKAAFGKDAGNGFEPAGPVFNEDIQLFCHLFDLSPTDLGRRSTTRWALPSKTGRAPGS